MHNTLPRYLQRIAFYQNCTIHDYDTRTQNELHITRTYHEYAKRCIRHNTTYHQHHHCTDKNKIRYIMQKMYVYTIVG